MIIGKYPSKMKKRIFSEKGVKLLKDDMNICLADLSEKILSDSPQHILFFRNLIDYMTEIKTPYQYGELGSSNNNKNQDYLNDKLFKFTKKWIDEEDIIAYEIYDNLRHAFVIYNEFGVYEVYKLREAELWYPKVIIRNNIGSRDFMKKLDNKVIVYRGTSNDEYESRKFSQAWTTSKDIAYQFAFMHYQGYPKYQNTERVLVKAKIDKQFIYYYNEDENEKEVILDEREILIDSLTLCEKKTLN